MPDSLGELAFQLPGNQGGDVGQRIAFDWRCCHRIAAQGRSERSLLAWNPVRCQIIDARADFGSDWLASGPSDLRFAVEFGESVFQILLRLDQSTLCTTVPHFIVESALAMAKSSIT